MAFVNGYLIKSLENSMFNRNRFLFLAFIYLFDLFPFLAGRLLLSNREFIIEDFSLVILLIIILSGFSIAVFNFWLCRLSLFNFKTRLVIPSYLASALIIISALSHVFFFFVLPHNFRYISGSLSGYLGVVYGVFNALTISIIVSQSIKILRQEFRFDIARKLFVFSLVFFIDGLSSTLLVCLFVYSIFVINSESKSKIFWTVIICVLFFLYGIGYKYFQKAYFEDISFSEFQLGWIVDRFSIQFEALHSYLSGSLLTLSSSGNFEFWWNGISNRFSLLLGNYIIIESPKTHSEAIFMDMYGLTGSGVSPGALLSIFYSPAIGLALMFYLSILTNLLFDRINRKLPYFFFFLLWYQLRVVHADFIEVGYIISPSFLAAAFILVSLTAKSREKSIGR